MIARVSAPARIVTLLLSIAGCGETVPAGVADCFRRARHHAERRPDGAFLEPQLRAECLARHSREPEPESALAGIDPDFAKEPPEVLAPRGLHPGSGR